MPVAATVPTENGEFFAQVWAQRGLAPSLAAEPAATIAAAVAAALLPTCRRKLSEGLSPGLATERRAGCADWGLRAWPQARTGIGLGPQPWLLIRD